MINGSSIVTQRKSTLKRKTLNIRFKHWISNTELCIQSTGSLFSHKLADLPDFWGLFLILTLLKFVSWDNLFWYVFSFYIKASLPVYDKKSLKGENSALWSRMTVLADGHRPYRQNFSLWLPDRTMPLPWGIKISASVLNIRAAVHSTKFQGAGHCIAEDTMPGVKC